MDELGKVLILSIIIMVFEKDSGWRNSSIFKKVFLNGDASYEGTKVTEPSGPRDFFKEFIY